MSFHLLFNLVIFILIRENWCYTLFLHAWYELYFLDISILLGMPHMAKFVSSLIVSPFLLPSFSRLCCTSVKMTMVVFSSWTKFVFFHGLFWYICNYSALLWVRALCKKQKLHIYFMWFNSGFFWCSSQICIFVSTWYTLHLV